MTATNSNLPWRQLLEDSPDEQLVATSWLAGQAPAVCDLPAELGQGLVQALVRVGITRLYTHQLAAHETALRTNTMITTGTASGKSLAFNLPVLHTLSLDPRARALYLYPTKALAQDQARKLNALEAPFLRPSIYDGDTPRRARRAIRTNSNLLLTNPDMLSVGILPHHNGWGDVFANLAFVVVDEAHAYRGVFGSHVANVLRRLRRVANAYGASPHFILTSATIANPVDLATRLCGVDFELVDSDGAPRASRQVAMWNPPVLDRPSGARRSVLSEAGSLLANLLETGTRSICFLNSRRGIELIAQIARNRLQERGHSDLAERIASYRGGYTAAQRRDIERKLADTELLAVVATDALELGIDVGELDASICVTFPGTVASLRQMWGRAGRTHTGLAMYVAGDDALDQFFCRHPEQFLSRPVESAILDHASELIHLQHLVCAAFELPLVEADAKIFGSDLPTYADRLVRLGRLRKTGGRYLPRGPDFPAGSVSLRSASAEAFAIVDQDSGEVIGSVEAQRAYSTVHPKAVYLHMGQSYEVQTLDTETRRALVSAFAGEWYTQPKTETETFIESVQETDTALGTALSFGSISVTEQVVAYQRKTVSDHEVIDLHTLDLPQHEFQTKALWFQPDDELLSGLTFEALLGALHACEHSQIAVLPLLAMCDRWDIGGLSTAFHHQTQRPTIFIYDGYPGGIGITRKGFEVFETLAENAWRLISECRCDSGCPSCVQSPKCGNLNEHLEKAGARRLLEGMLANRTD
jgi:DEAD/DEAH box helicase domain-containing protein